MISTYTNSQGYKADSNDENGLGRLDLRFRDKPNRRYLLFKFKRSAKEEDLEKDCDEAIWQIRDRGYAKILPEGYKEQIYCKKGQFLMIRAVYRSISDWISSVSSFS